MNRPPKLITRLVERLASPRESEIILGDMYEEFEERLKESGRLRANMGYFVDFASLLLHRVLRRKKEPSSNFFTMLISNYLKVGFRQLGRQKLHNTINIAGLAVGLAVTFVITLFVLEEISHDRFHTKADRLYLLPMTWKFQSTRIDVAGSTSAAGPLMAELFDKEIENFVRIEHLNKVFKSEQGSMPENLVYAADSTFFDLFTFPLIAGNPREALREPNSIVLTERAALKYFGKNEAFGQTLTEQSGRLYKVTAVVKDPPTTSHIRFDMLISMSSLPKKEWEPNWDKSPFNTYVLLEPNASAAAIVADIPARIEKRYSKEHNDHVELDLIPMTDVYLKNQKYSGLQNSDIRYVYIFSTIAILVLVIAVINYMNLSTARSMERAREVGVRKVVGALRMELFWQFISESILISFASVVLAVLLAYMLLPVFNGLSEKNLSLGLFQHPERIAAVVFIWLLISFLGGAYPAMILSGFRPIGVLKGKLGTSGSGSILRKSLVVFQFAISILLIVSTLTINNQLSFMVNKKLGVDKEQLVMIPLDSLARANLSTIRTELASISGVERSSTSSSTPVNNGAKTTVYGGDIGDKQLLIYNLGVGPDVVKTTGLEILAGNDLSAEIPADGSWEYLINESAVEFFGWTNETAVGKRLMLWQTDGVIKGVVRDFHFLPLQKPIEPLLIHAGKGNGGAFLSKLLVRIEGDNFEGVSSAIQERWRKIVPGSPLDLVFLDDLYKNVLYRSESRLSTIMNIFSTLAIFIAGLGLFGLASYTIMQRTKELGIRKVLGASLSGLLMVVSRGFMILVLVAFALATPVSWYLMDKWMQNFAYPVGFNWMIVIAAGVASVVVAFGTVFYHAFGAARMNPATTLRTE
ncbi:MAG TPA: FtsX-like permease family protein [Cyclobacteriaceae bacterium]|nr:FtsX-like permease family protein [Cyclobacteriaceae bacterium]